MLLWEKCSFTNQSWFLFGQYWTYLSLIWSQPGSTGKSWHQITLNWQVLSFLLSPCTQREHLERAGIEPRSSSSAIDCSSHLTMASRVWKLIDIDTLSLIGRSPTGIIELCVWKSFQRSRIIMTPRFCTKLVSRHPTRARWREKTNNKIILKNVSGFRSRPDIREKSSDRNSRSVSVNLSKDNWMQMFAVQTKHRDLNFVLGILKRFEKSPTDFSVKTFSNPKSFCF